MNPVLGNTSFAPSASVTFAGVTATYSIIPLFMLTQTCFLKPYQNLCAVFAPIFASLSAAYFSTFSLLSFSYPARIASSLCSH